MHLQSPAQYVSSAAVTPGPRATCPEADDPVWSAVRRPDRGRHRNGGSRWRRGRSIEVARHGIGRTDPLLDHPYHLDDPRRVAHPGAHLVTGDTMVDGFAGRSLTRTCPPRHAAAASGRVFVSRTAHRQRSTRVDSHQHPVASRPAHRGQDLQHAENEDDGQYVAVGSPQVHMPVRQGRTPVRRCRLH